VTFLSPAPAIAAAMVAVPALLLLYFLKLRRRPLRVSSTLLWEQAIRDLQVNVPFRMLRVTLLLLLQLLILALFLLALARPAIHAFGDAAPRIILLLDRSASMSARDGGDGRTRLEAAKEAAVAWLANLSRRGSTPAVAVVAFAAQPRALTALSPDLSAARAAIDGVQPTDQPGDLGAALRLAGAMAAADADESAPRASTLVVLFSDGGVAGEEGYSLPGAEFRFQRIGPAPGGPRQNLGFVALAARRDWDDPATVRLFARIQNAAESEATAPVALLLDGTEVERRALTVPGRAAAAPGAPVPGEATVTFSLPLREGGLAELRLDHPDLLEADNRVALVIPAARKPRITLVVPDPALGPDGQPTRGPEWILRDLLEEMSLPLRVRTAASYNAGSPADLNADLVIFDRVRPGAVPAVPSISFGAGLPAPGLDAGEALDAGTYVVSWDRSDPILRHVALDTLYLTRPLALGAPAPGTRIVELARGASGPLMLLSRDGPSRLVVGFELARSNWPLQVGFPIFMAAAIDELTMRAQDMAGHYVQAGQPVHVENVSGTVTLDGPTRLTVEAPARDGGVTFSPPERAGAYRVTTPRGAGGAVAVDLLSPEESALETRDSIRVAGEDVAALQPGRGPRELWPWLVAAALVLLSLEWFVNAWLMRV
jgi:hypothetical protein